jgi:DNA-binding response OmpR family regulator
MNNYMESEAGRIPGVAVREAGSQDLSSFDGRAFDRRNIHVPLQPIEWPSGNYQVALVPLGHNSDRAGSVAAMEMSRVLMLPLTWRELVVRLRTQICPSGFPLESRVVRFGEVSADFSTMEVSRAGEKVTLTAMELKLLQFLVHSPGRVISRDEMLDKVWGYNNYPSTRTVDNHILRLRQKLESDPANPVHFRTVHRMGYKFDFQDGRVAAELQM